MNSRVSAPQTEQPIRFTNSSPPLSHRGAHRDGFSEKKCRDVLVRHCSHIPRNYNFRDGLNLVYMILREYLGDENLDLAIAQLNELIEVPSDCLHDEGAAFQSWKHDYMLRHKDFENSHVPRLGNIIVAPVKPTERLLRWREQQSEDRSVKLLTDHSSGADLGETMANPPTSKSTIGPAGRQGWRVEQSLFVSNRAEGTRVVHCPSPQELHKKTWNEDFGRGGKLVNERTIIPGDPIDRIDPRPPRIPSFKEKKSLADLRSTSSFSKLPPIRRIRSITLELPQLIRSPLAVSFSARTRNQQLQTAATEKKKVQLRRRYRPDPLLGRFDEDVSAYESNPAVIELPDPNDEFGREYYRNVSTWPLPVGVAVPNPEFARRHGLVPPEVSLPESVEFTLMPTADEMAIRKAFQNYGGTVYQSCTTPFNGPFTPELFKDSGIDFPENWGGAEGWLSPDEDDGDILSDMGSLGDSAQSPLKFLYSINERMQTNVARSGTPSPEPAGDRHDPVEAAFQHLRQYSAQQVTSSTGEPLQVEGGRARKNSWAQKVVSRRGTIGAVHAGLPRLRRDSTQSRSTTTSETHHNGHRGHRNHHRLKPTSSISSRQLKDRFRDIVTHYQKAAVVSSTMRVVRETESPPSPPDHVDGGILTPTSSQDSEPEPSMLPQPALTVVAPSKTFSDKTEHDSQQVSHPASVSSTSPGSTSQIIVDSLPESYVGNGGKAASEIPRVYVNKQHSHTPKKLITAIAKSAPENSPPFLDEVKGHARNSSFPLDYELTYKMDLNRDLPPLPVPTPTQPLHIRKQSQEYHPIKATPDTKPETLFPLCYDPVRDSLKYGGIQYHPEGVRCHPKVPRHPPRTSSILTSTAHRKADSVATQLQAGTGGRIRTTQTSRPSTTLPNHQSDTPSEIMGNFVPLEKSDQVVLTSSEVMRSITIPAICRDGNSSAKHEGISSEAPQQMSKAEKLPKPDTGHPGAKKEFTHHVHNKNGLDDIDLNDPLALIEYVAYDKKKSLELPLRKSFYVSPWSVSTDKYEHDGTDGSTVVNVEDHKEGITNVFKYSAEDYQKLAAGNPYEFKHEARINGSDRMTTLTKFLNEMELQQSSPVSPRRKLGHLKNSHSESNTAYMVKQPEPIRAEEFRGSNGLRQRSGSSPGILPLRPSWPLGTVSNTYGASHGTEDGSYLSSPNSSRYGHESVASPSRGRGFPRSPVKHLEGLPENGEAVSDLPTKVQKRSRSPMKKMFGEGGWLSNAADPKEESRNTKRQGLVNKIKIKIEEIGLKADINTVRNVFKINHDRAVEPSKFAISLKPVEQAEVYLDVELLICDSANTFLMHEYRNCRMSLDSITKVIDFWTSKGRPQVLEFHYDQATQRDLIVANQKNFQFYGPDANNALQVHAMLYAWKNIAREMAIRTFCYPDSMILKHIHETFMIMDFLGGHPAQYLALREVHAKVNHWIKEAEQSMLTKSSAANGLMNVKSPVNEVPAEGRSNNSLGFSTTQTAQRISPTKVHAYTARHSIHDIGSLKRSSED